MSRIGKNPVVVPNDVNITMNGQIVTAKGKLGELAFTVCDEIVAAMEDNKIVVKMREDTARSRAMWGTTQARLNNMVVGVSQGFSKKLEIVGVGYRAQVKGKVLILQLGYSHDINFPIPDGIDIKCEKPTAIAIAGADKQQVGQVAAEIRNFRRPEPYKGKGVRYADEYILRKEGKKK